MTRSTTRVTVALTAAGFLALWGGAYAAQGPSSSDFDACNREAQVAMSTSGSTTASSGTSGTPGAGSSSSTTPSTSTPSASPSTSGTYGSGSGGVSAGTSSGTGAGSGDTANSSGSGTGAAGAASTDQALQGMAAAGHGNPAYEQTYRDCMRRRGF